MTEERFVDVERAEVGVHHPGLVLGQVLLHARPVRRGLGPPVDGPEVLVDADQPAAGELRKALGSRTFVRSPAAEDHDAFTQGHSIRHALILAWGQASKRYPSPGSVMKC